MGLNPPRALKAVAGQVLLQGTDVLKQPAHGLRRLRGEKMAMIFQEPMTALNPVMKVGEQIGEVLQIHSDLGLGNRKSVVYGKSGSVRGDFGGRSNRTKDKRKKCKT